MGGKRRRQRKERIINKRQIRPNCEPRKAQQSAKHDVQTTYTDAIATTTKDNPTDRVTRQRQHQQPKHRQEPIVTRRTPRSKPTNNPRRPPSHKTSKHTHAQHHHQDHHYHHQSTHTSSKPKTPKGANDDPSISNRPQHTQQWNCAQRPAKKRTWASTNATRASGHMCICVGA